MTYSSPKSSTLFFLYIYTRRALYIFSAPDAFSCFTLGQMAYNFISYITNIDVVTYFGCVLMKKHDFQCGGGVPNSLKGMFASDRDELACAHGKIIYCEETE